MFFFLAGKCWKCPQKQKLLFFRKNILVAFFVGSPQKQSNVDTSNFNFFDKIQDGHHNGDPIIFIFESVQLLTHTNVQ